MAQQQLPQQNAAQRGRQARTPEPLPMWMKLFLLVTLAPLIAVLFPTFMIIGLGMLPTVATYLSDRGRSKAFSITVALTNLCGVLPSLAQLWDHGQSMQAANEIVAQPLFWALALGAAAVGWLLFMSMPPLIAVYYTTAADARIRNLMIKQQKLVETWGDEVKGEDEEVDAAGGDDAGAETIAG